MESNKSLDVVKLLIAALCDVHSLHGVVFNKRSLRLTVAKLQSRVRHEGLGFLTKTMPRLAKGFDIALAGGTPLNSIDYGFDAMDDSKLPRFLGELFSHVLQKDGTPLHDPCISCVRHIRQILLALSKYELPYNHEQEQQVISQFERTESDLSTLTEFFENLVNNIDKEPADTSCEPATVAIAYRRKFVPATSVTSVARTARALLECLFAGFDASDIIPRHGPGAVATKQQLWEKYHWTNVASRVTDMYPFDAYFCASAGHVCDGYRSFRTIGHAEHPARVILVPKDSRGPRLISAEPVEFQWIQGGLRERIVELVEHHRLTRDCVFFSDQGPNRFGALLGSSTGKYATLDLKEASDRVHLSLVRLLFPDHLYRYLVACRSSCTMLPDGRILKLNKFAPMGSSLCFPIMALTIWAILSAAAPDTYTRERIHVYGDDVIVPTAYAANAIEQLELFGLKINLSKSCTGGFFRESCGCDAYKGETVTPVRFRTVWSSSRSPDAYASWIEYSNQLFDRKYFAAYDYIVGRLHALYGAIPARDMHLTCPSLAEVPDEHRPKIRRVQKDYQVLQYKVWVLKSNTVHHNTSPGWEKLLRYFTETANSVGGPSVDTRDRVKYLTESESRVCQYTRRGTSMLVRRWR